MSSRSVIAIAAAIAMALSGCRHLPMDGECAAGQAEAFLRRQIAQSQGFRQVRAIEALGGTPPGFRFRGEATPQEQIGRCRVLAAAGDRQCAARIMAIALDPSRPEQCHALESAAKLSLKTGVQARGQLQSFADGADRLRAGYSCWLLAANGAPEASMRLTRQLESQGDFASTAAYASAFLDELPVGREAALRQILAGGTLDSQLAAFALFAMCRHRRLDAEAVRERLAAMDGSTPEKVRRFHYAALGHAGDGQDLPRLLEAMNHEEPECAIAAAGAILQITGNKSNRQHAP